MSRVYSMGMYCFSEVELSCVKYNKSWKVCTSHMCFHNFTICKYSWDIMPQDVLGLIPCRVLGNFQVNCSFCLYSVAMGSSQPLNTNDYQGISLGVKCNWQVELTVLPNVKVKMEAQHVGGFHSTTTIPWTPPAYQESAPIYCAQFCPLYILHQGIYSSFSACKSPVYLAVIFYSLLCSLMIDQ